MILFFYVPSMKDKTFCRDNEPACRLNNIMYSDHSVSVLQRWGAHTWVPYDCCLLKPVWRIRKLSLSGTTAGVYGTGPPEELNPYRNSCWCLKSSVASSVILQTRSNFVIAKNSWWEGSSGGRLVWNVWNVLREPLGSLVMVHITQTQCKSLRKLLFHCWVSMGVWVIFHYPTINTVVKVTFNT